jgi:hypothetical protein
MSYATAPVAVLSLAVFLGVAAAAPSQGPWILTCNMAGPNEAASSPNAQRVFRIGPQLFQQWLPQKNAFGRNLCISHRCERAADHLGGTISSPSLVLTVTLDLTRGTASWRTQGASNLRTNSGPCTVGPDKPPAHAG